MKNKVLERDMENEIDSFCKTTMKNKVIERKFLVDLARDMLGLILSKLHFTDQIRFRAVCRSWRVPEDELTRCSDNLPWIITHIWTYETSRIYDIVSYICKLSDPYSEKIHRVPNSMSFLFKKDSNIPTDLSVVYASKHGWLLLGCQSRASFLPSPSSSPFLFSSSPTLSLLMHNPFTNEVILLPPLSFDFGAVATFSNDPSSDECKIFILFRRDVFSDSLYIGTYCLSRDENWSVDLIDEINAVCHSVHYVKQKLYLLYNHCNLKSYDLADNYSKELLMTVDIPDSHYWLIENKGDLLIVWHHCVDYQKWFLIRFDLSEMGWDFEENLKNTALFISGNVSFSRSLTDGENVQDCRVFFVVNMIADHVDEDPRGRIFCFSFRERKLINSREYSWIEQRTCRTSTTFIEPPYVRH